VGATGIRAEFCSLPEDTAPAESQSKTTPDRAIITSVSTQASTNFQFSHWATGAPAGFSFPWMTAANSSFLKSECVSVIRFAEVGEC
jgi:hypothetical protein